MKKSPHKFLDLLVGGYLQFHPDQLKPLDQFSGPPSRILVISCTALGDTLLSTPALKSIRNSFPQARISLLVYHKLAPLFSGLPHIDRTILFRRGSLPLLSIARELRREAPEVVLIMHGNAPHDIALAVLSGAGFILKHPTTSPYRRFLSHEFPQQYQHAIESRLDLVRAIGGTALDRTMEVQPLTDRVRADRIAADLAGAGRVVGFQVGASHSYNMWPIDCFIQLAERILADDLEVTIVVTGIDRERPLGERLVQACGKRVLNLCGSYGIADLPYLIRRFSLLVTGDTGPMHLAIAMKVPTISLFSAADPRFTGPYQDAGLHRVIRKDGSFIKSLPKKQRDDSAMRLIPVDEVFAAYEESMRR